MFRRELTEYVEEETGETTYGKARFNRITKGKDVKILARERWTRQVADVTWVGERVLFQFDKSQNEINFKENGKDNQE